MPKKTKKFETDGTYFFKILLYFVIGTIWIKVNGHTVVPLGLLLGVLFSRHEHFQIDRKVEYAILLVATLLGLIGFGIFISIGT